MIEFSKIKYHLAGNRESNAKLEEFFKLKKNSLFNLTGIKKRFISNKYETTENLAIKVCKKIDRLEF